MSDNGTDGNEEESVTEIIPAKAALREKLLDQEADLSTLTIPRVSVAKTDPFELSMETNAHDQVFHFAKEDYDVVTKFPPISDSEVRKSLRMLSFDPKVLTEKENAYDTMEEFDRFVRNLAPFRKRALNKGLTEELVLEEVIAEHLDFKLRDKVN